MCNSETKYLQAISLGNDQFPEHLLFVVLSRQQKMQRQRYCMDYCTTNGVMMLHLFTNFYRSIGSHTHRVYVCLDVICNLHFCQRDLGLIHPAWGARGGMYIEIIAQKVLKENL